MRKSSLPILIALVALLALLGGAVFVVDETQQVVITQFGRPIEPAIAEPGVHFKLPFIQDANYFEKRFLEWNGAPNQIPTKDKRFIAVDTFARWRIIDPLRFYQRLRDERTAQSRLDDIIDGATRNAVARHDLVEVVRSTNRDVQLDPDLAEEEQLRSLEQVSTGRLGIATLILQAANERATDLGIEVKDVRFKRLNYNETVSQTVYQRMIAERKRIAERFRSEGLGESARIRGEKERELKSIESEAYESAQRIIGKADAEASAIFAEAYGVDPDFYRFLRTLETYKQVIDARTWLVMSTDSELFEYLERTRPRP